MKTKKASLITGFIYIILHLQAQQISPNVLSSQGGKMQNGNTVLTYTIGQPTPTGLPLLSAINNLVITPGFQQPMVPLPPTTPVAQTACSDTPYIFTVNDTAAKGTNYIEWALNSNFESPQYIAVRGSFAVTVNPGSADTVWIRGAIASPYTPYPVFTQYSAAVSAVLKVNPLPQQLSPYPGDFTVCAGNTTTINVPNSQAGIKYKLAINTTAIDSSFGNAYNLIFNTDSIDTSTVFNVWATDTTTGCATTLANAVGVKVDTGPPAPQFVAGDTVIHADSICCFRAWSPGIVQIKYSIISGYATIDSFSGCVTSVDSNFTVRATAYNMSGCVAKTADLPVRVTQGADTTTSKSLKSLRALAQIPPNGEWDFTGGDGDVSEDGGDDGNAGSDWLYQIKETSDGGYVAIGYGWDESDGQVQPSILKLDHNGIPIFQTVVSATLNANSAQTDKITMNSGRFWDVTEYIPSAGDTSYIALGRVTVNTIAGGASLADNRMILLAQFGTTGALLNYRIIENTFWASGTGTPPPGYVNVKNIQVTPARDGFIISSSTDAWHNFDGQEDVLLFDISADFATVNWQCHYGAPDEIPGPGDSWTSGEFSWVPGNFVIDPNSISGSNYDLYWAGGAANAVTTDNLSNSTSSVPVWNESTYLFVAYVPLTNTTTTCPTSDVAVNYMDLSTFSNYTPLSNAPYYSYGTPGKVAGDDAINFFENNHYDFGYNIIVDNQNPGQLVIAAGVNDFDNTGGAHNQCYPGNNNTPQGRGYYKDMDVALIRTSEDDVFGTGTTAQQVMHLSGDDFQPGFGQDINGNFYVSGTCGDDSKSDYTDGMDDLASAVNYTQGPAAKWLSTSTPAYPPNVMHVAKFDNNFNWLWEFTYLSNQWATEPSNSPTYNECSSAFALNDEGGFVIGGNNCIRGDDYIVHKFYTDCELNNYGYEVWPYPPEAPYAFIAPIGNHTFDGTSSPFNTIPARVQGTILIPSGANTTFSGLTLEFANSKQFNSFNNILNFATQQTTPVNYTINPTRIVIEPGGSLTLDGCTLRGISSCYDGHNMQWDGIVLKGTPQNTPQALGNGQGQLILTDGTIIQDALTGVTVDGLYNGGQVNDNGWAYNTNTWQPSWGTPNAFGWGEYSINTGSPQGASWGWATYKQTYQYPGQGGGILQTLSADNPNCTFTNCNNGIVFATYNNTNTSYLNNCVFNESDYMAEPINRNYTLNTHVTLSGINSGTTELFNGCTFNNSFYASLGVNQRGFGIVDYISNYIVGSSSDVNTFENLTTGIEHDNIFYLSGQLVCNNATFTNNQNGVNLRGTLGDYITGCTFNVPASSADIVSGSTFNSISTAGIATYGANLFVICGANHFNGVSSGLTAQAGIFIQSCTTTGGSVSDNYFDGNAWGLQTALSNPEFHYRQNFFGQTTDNFIGVGLNPNDSYTTRNMNDNGSGLHLPDNTFPPLDVFLIGLNISLLTGTAYDAASQYAYGLDDGANGNEVGSSVYWSTIDNAYDYYAADDINPALDLPPHPFTDPHIGACSDDYNTCDACKDLTVSNPDSVSMDERAAMVIQILGDTLAASKKTSNLITYLENFSDWDAQQLLVPAYYQLGNYSDMNTHLGAIRDTSEYAHDFKTFYTMMAAARQQGRDYNHLTGGEWAAVRNFALNSKNGIGSIAQNLLFRYKDEYHQLSPSTVKLKPFKSKKVNTETAVLTGLQINPNPMVDAAIIQYTLPENADKGLIQITDMVGNPVTTYNIAAGTGQISLNNPGFAAGMYFCILRQDDKIVDVKKFIKL